jgi:hypothetical protein
MVLENFICEALRLLSLDIKDWFFRISGRLYFIFLHLSEGQCEQKILKLLKLLKSSLE